ncbi:hypothetical protein NM688_g2582 [Phlebia brevispora]|uniref:Uncharacterized protein n=1 Tax=Phlebia brevispora TaxID=194682 RepID=A0ACC1T883_9APHY|nr:hypothetical protein NM688_g2582 [Phlebia brevispora]
MSTLLDVALLLTGCAHVYLAPYTKVEESFNLHATHDVLMYGIGQKALSNYDHFVFPGAVPRTFLGSVLLAWFCKPFIPLAEHAEFLSNKFDLQLLARFVLVFYNTIGFSLLRRAVSRRFGGPTGVWFVVLTCTQFHVPFWMGRTLPNMFALLPTNLAFYLLYSRAPNSLRPSARNVHMAIAILTFATVVFRSELLLLLAPLVLQSLISEYTTIKKIIQTGIIAGVASIALTVSVDSYFWQRYPLWPELYGLYFNVVQGKSSDWGVSPFHAYFTSHLPKLLLSSSVLSFVGAVIDRRIRSLLWPAITFVLLLSGLGHKEWRFIVYAVPLFNIAAARAAAWLVSIKKSIFLGRLGLATAAVLVIANCLATTVLTAVSIDNYPGGKALTRFNDMYAEHKHVHVHISNLAAQTGASLFLQTHSPPYLPGLAPPAEFSHWTYNKTENLTPALLTSSHDITHAIAEVSANGARNTFEATGFPGGSWRMTGVVTAFQRLNIDKSIATITRRPWEVVQFLRSEELAILERK